MYFLIGSDTLPEFPTWHEPQRIARAATLVVKERPGFPVPSPAELQAAIGEPVRMQNVEVPLIDLSSHEIRRRVAQGRSIRYMVPRAVEVYIGEKGLYRE